MRIPFTRRPLPPAPPEPEDVPGPVRNITEAEIAIGSLSGIAPSRILRHVLVVADTDGGLWLSTSACKNELPQLLSLAMQDAMLGAAQASPCYHEGVDL